VYTVGTRLFVACGLLTNFVATVPGKVYVVDTATDTLIPGATVTLPHKNPLGWFERFPDGGTDAGDLLIPTVENFTTAPGCLERVSTGDTPAAAGCVVDNASLGGYAVRTDIEVDSSQKMVWSAVAIPGDNNHGKLLGYDLANSALASAPLNPVAEKISDVAHCPSGQLVVFDSNAAAPGLRIYAGGAETTTKALRIGSALQSLPQHGIVCY
jgi:hypothetical protein